MSAGLARWCAAPCCAAEPGPPGMRRLRHDPTDAAASAGPARGGWLTPIASIRCSLGAPSPDSGDTRHQDTAWKTEPEKRLRRRWHRLTAATRSRARLRPGSGRGEGVDPVFEALYL